MAASGMFFLVLLPSLIFYIGKQYQQVANTYSSAQDILLNAQQMVAEHAASSTQPVNTNL